MEQSLVVYSIVIPLFYFLAKGVVREASIVKLPNGVVYKRNGFLTMNTILIIILFAVFSGIRYDVGRDYLSYLYCYLNFERFGDTISSGYEYGFTFLMEKCNKLKLSPMIFFGIIALVQMTFFLLAFRREKRIWPFLLLFFFVNGGFMLWMNGVRQCMALCIWMCSIYYIEDKKPIWYFLFCFLSLLFHTSAVILIVLYPLMREGKSFFRNIPIQYTIIVVSFIIRIAFSGVLLVWANVYLNFTGGAYDNYGENVYSGSYSNTGIIYWYRLLVYCLIIFYSEDLHVFYNSKRFNIIYTLFFIGVISRCLIPLDMSFLSRPFLYFTFFDSIMLAYFVYYLSNTFRQRNKELKTILIVSFTMAFFANQMVSGSNSSVWYQFFFDQPVIKTMFY